MGAPLPPIAQHLRIFLKGFVDGEDTWEWGNVLHFRYTGTPPSNAVCGALATDISNAWYTEMAPRCPSPTTLTEVTVTDLTSDTAGEGIFAGSIAGTRGDDSIPANAAVLISYPATQRFKGGHFRSYLYVGGNADLEGAAKWTALFTSEVQAHWINFLLAVQGLSQGGTNIADMAQVRYYGKYAPNDGPPRYRLVTPIVTGFDPNNSFAAQEIASQRRRVGRRKR